MSDEGNIFGTALLDFNGQTPALELDLKIPKMTLTGFKQLWPYPVASKARRWIIDNMKAGNVKDARLKANIPHGILGRIRKGAVIEREQLQATVPIINGRFKVLKELPDIQNAVSTVHVDGMSVNLELDKGHMILPSKRKLDLTNSIIFIDGQKPKPAPNSIDAILKVKGVMHDVLTLVSESPINAKLPNDFKPNNIKGNFDGEVKLNFLLEKKIKKEAVKWFADFDVINFASKKPIQNVMMTSQKLHVQLNPSFAEVNGDVIINDIPAKMEITQNLNKKIEKASTRKIKIIANAKVRKKLGINLDNMLTGTLPVTVNFQEGQKHYNVNADLTNVELKLPWVNWKKGKGIKGTLSFKYLGQGNKKTISDFTLKGNKFYAKGDLTINDSELSRAKFSKIILNPGDNIAVDLKHNANTYTVNVSGKSYDARAVISKVLDGADQASATVKNAGNLKMAVKITALTVRALLL